MPRKNRISRPAPKQRPSRIREDQDTRSHLTHLDLQLIRKVVREELQTVHSELDYMMKRVFTQFYYLGANNKGKLDREYFSTGEFSELLPHSASWVSKACQREEIKSFQFNPAGAYLIPREEVLRIINSASANLINPLDYDSL